MVSHLWILASAKLGLRVYLVVLSVRVVRLVVFRVSGKAVCLLFPKSGYHLTGCSFFLS